MDLIEKLDMRFTGGCNRRFGLFLCPYCKKEVEKTISHGKRDKSCGCNTFTHRKTNHLLYRTWNHMKQRCINPNVKEYKNYGGRGISVCKEWKNDFKAFYNWAMDNGYKSNLTIDRIDNNQGYYPNNCRWATNKEQQRNTRHNHLITYKGKTYCITEWAEILNINVSTLYCRLKRNWSVEKTFIEKVDVTKRSKAYVKFGNI